MRLLLAILITLLVTSPVYSSDRCGALLAEAPNNRKPITLSELQSDFKAPFKVGASPDGAPIYRINSQSDFARARANIKRYGIDRFFEQMVALEIFGSDGKVLPSTKPFNPFARIALGVMEVPYGNILETLGLRANDVAMLKASQDFMVAKNLPEHDKNWNNYELASKGQASMSLRHRFLIPRDPQWSNFNVLTIGLANRRNELQKSIEYLKYMKQTAHEFVRREREFGAQDVSQNWSENIGLYFHCFPFNSVQYLHLHVVDLNHTGPAFHHMENKNLSIDQVILQLEAELAIFSRN